MGWFNRSAHQDTVRPVTQDRIAALFDREEWHYKIDDDGDLMGWWDANPYYFILAGENKEILQIVGYLDQSIGQEHLSELRVFIEDWHRDHYWPKAYFLTDPETGELRLSASVPIDDEFGVTDAQLFQHVKCGLGTIGQIFDAAVEHFHLVTPE